MTCLSFVAYGQQLDRNLYRTIDGTYNNLQHIEWGAANENLRLLSPQMGYADGIAAPGGVDRPNPRQISNEIFSQNIQMSDPLNLSDFTWVFGQFIDHDIGFTPDGPEDASIRVPRGDDIFDPGQRGNAVIAMHRNAFDEATGTGVDNPRRHPNFITAYIDASSVYGSDEFMADWLRSHVDGKMKVSAGNLLPFNTMNGEYEGEIDPNAPHMENPVGLSRKQFVAGDVRANENPLLLSFHTLFVREHNRICDELKQEHPEWGDEELYQHARKMVGGILQSIVYNEWLPTMGVDLPPYEGYDANIHAQLFNSFTAAAFRMGHTLLNGNLQRVMNDGTNHPEGALRLRRAFFNPFVVMEDGGLDPFLKGMGVQIQQPFDNRVVDDVRNFLFGPPGSPGLDLAAININRGRERGLLDFNSIRETLGLPRYQMVQQINSNILVALRLSNLYGDLDNIDAWVGMLAEEKEDGELFGETVKAMMSLQFELLRDGDRFFYENDPVLTDTEKAEIRETTMHDVIMRNTGIRLIQSNVFRAMEHDQICSSMDVNLFGHIQTEDGEPVSDVLVELLLRDGTMESVTSQEGGFELANVPGCFVDKMVARKSKDDYQNGVTTFDMVLVQRHILGSARLNSPYKIIAADVDMSGSITTLDLIRMRRVILAVATDFGGSPSWRFIPADYVFSDPQDPLADPIVSEYEFDLLSKDAERDFIAIKLGDLNNSALTSTGSQVAGIRSDLLGMQLRVNDYSFAGGDQVEVPFATEGMDQLSGFQFGLTYNEQVLELIDVRSEQITSLGKENVGVLSDRGWLTTSWHQPAGRSVNIKAGTAFTLVFRALQPGKLSDHLMFDPRIMPSESYQGISQQQPLTISFEGDEMSITSTFRVGQNQPNPFAQQTVIPFELPEENEVELTVSDAQGRVMLQRSGSFAAGAHQFIITDADLTTGGVYQYQLKAGDLILTRKMVKVNDQ